MRIDIDSLTEAELVDLNNRIVERLKERRALRPVARAPGWQKMLEMDYFFAGKSGMTRTVPGVKRSGAWT